MSWFDGLMVCGEILALESVLSEWFASTEMDESELQLDAQGGLSAEQKQAVSFLTWGLPSAGYAPSS